MKDELRIAVTGHRPIRISGREQDIENWIREELKRINCIEAYSGMAQGTDQIFAKIVEELGIPLICCYPYKRFTFHPLEEEINAKAKDVRFIKFSRLKTHWLTVDGMKAALLKLISCLSKINSICWRKS